MTHSAIKIDRFPDLQPKRFVHLRVKFCHSLENDGKLISFVSKKIFELIDGTSMQFHQYWREALSNKVLRKISVSINSRFDDETFFAPLNAAATDMQIRPGILRIFGKEPRDVDIQRSRQLQ